MFPLGEIVMKIDKLLVSSSMLTAMCEKTNADNLKLLEPFVLVCLSDTTEPREEVPKGKILAMLEERFALQAMPEAVLDKILTRIAKGKGKIVYEKRLANKDGRHFELVQKPLRQVQAFLVQEEKAKQDSESVIKALITWIQENRVGHTPSPEDAKKYLGTFFEANGFDILFEPEELRGATIKNTDATNYQIGRFILNAQEHDSELFKKIVAIAQGMILVSVIYVDTTPASKFAAMRRLAGVDVFLDTTFLLYALGYKTEGQKRAADVLLDLLKNNGAHLFVFQNHFSEIVEILNAFKEQDSYSLKNGQTLEALEAEGYTSIEIDSEIRNLRHSLEKIGIVIAPETKYTDDNGKLIENKNAYIDYVGLRAYLTNKIPSYGVHPKMLDNDVSAVASIMVRRSGMTYSDIESCEAIFVTTNYSLVRHGNQFLHYPPYTMHITPIISDMDITTILWVKYAMTMCADISQLQLVEYARAALTPSVSVMDTFNSIARRLVKKGSMTEDEAANIRYSAYARAEIATACGGDPANLDDTSILAVRDRVKEQYAIQETERANKAVADLRKANRAVKAARTSANLTSKQLEAVQKNIKKEIAKLRKAADNRAKSRAAIFGRVAQGAITLFIMVVMATMGWATAKEGFSASLSTSGIVALIAAVASAVLLCLPALKLSSLLYKAVSSMLFDKFYNWELKRLQPEIDRLASIAGVSDITLK